MRRAFGVIQGGLHSNERIVFSLQHPVQQIDVPASAVLGIVAHEWQFFPGVERGYPLPYVEVTLDSQIRARIYRWSKALSDPKLGIVKFKLIVAGRCVCEPVIDEPVGAVPSFILSTGDFEQAKELAALLNAQR